MAAEGSLPRIIYTDAPTLEAQGAQEDIEKRYLEQGIRYLHMERRTHQWNEWGQKHEGLVNFIRQHEGLCATELQVLYEQRNEPQR